MNNTDDKDNDNLSIYLLESKQEMIDILKNPPDGDPEAEKDNVPTLLVEEEAPDIKFVTPQDPHMPKAKSNKRKEKEWQYIMNHQMMILIKILLVQKAKKILFWKNKQSKR